MLKPGGFDLARQLHYEAFGKQGPPIAIPLACSHQNMVGGEIDVLDAESRALGNPQAGAVHQHGHQPVDPPKLSDDRTDLVTGQNDRQTLRSLGPNDLVQALTLRSSTR